MDVQPRVAGSRDTWTSSVPVGVPVHETWISGLSLKRIETASLVMVAAMLCAAMGTPPTVIHSTPSWLVLKIRPVVRLVTKGSYHRTLTGVTSRYNKCFPLMMARPG